jgi:hypothetical protein
MLYLMHDDDELAAQAFSRSQANDPENAVAWLGQAFLAVRSNDTIEAHELYQHAFEISESSFVSLLSDVCLHRLLQVIVLLKLHLIKQGRNSFCICRFHRRLSLR